MLAEQHDERAIGRRYLNESIIRQALITVVDGEFAELETTHYRKSAPDPTTERMTHGYLHHLAEHDRFARSARESPKVR